MVATHTIKKKQKIIKQS